jgi:D-inositol-3-phosphate glycosyltransferase
MFHTLGEMKNRIARSEAEREGEYRIQGERQVLRRADRIIAATIAEVTQLRFLYKASANKLVVIPPGVDVSHFYPIPADEAKLYVGLKPDDRMVLFVGRIEPLKGVDTLIQAMSCLQLKEERPVHLAIIGGDPAASPQEMSSEMARLQKLCDDLYVGQTVVFLGKRDQDKLPYYVERSRAARQNESTSGGIRAGLRLGKNRQPDCGCLRRAGKTKSARIRIFARAAGVQSFSL